MLVLASLAVSIVPRQQVKVQPLEGANVRLLPQMTVVVGLKLALSVGPRLMLAQQSPMAVLAGRVVPVMLPVEPASWSSVAPAGPGWMAVVVHLAVPSWWIVASLAVQAKCSGTG